MKKWIMGVGAENLAGYVRAAALLAVLGPLVAGCAGGYPPPPGRVAYGRATWLPPPPMYELPAQIGPMIATPQRQDNSAEKSSGNGGSAMRPEGPVPSAGPAAPPAGDSAPNTPPDNGQASNGWFATRPPPSPTCGYWRLGCGILWP